MTFYEFMQEFPNDKACLDYMMVKKYGGTSFDCPSCKKKSNFTRLANRRAYCCQWCGHNLYPCVGTPMESSRTPLHKWFYAVFLMTSTRNGVSAKELERQLGVTYKCAWRLAHKIREVMSLVDANVGLANTVEVDETYVGGKRYRGRRSGKKTILVGMLERGGSVKTKVVSDTKARTLKPLIISHVKPGSMINTDELPSYTGLDKMGRMSYGHGVVCHRAGQYVDGEVHTNSLEGFWSQLKRSIRGTHVWVSGKHLQKYADEFSFRHNRRSQPDEMFSDVVENLDRKS